jgi:hypothetical protein
MEDKEAPQVQDHQSDDEQITKKKTNWVQTEARKKAWEKAQKARQEKLAQKKKAVQKPKYQKYETVVDEESEESEEERYYASPKVVVKKNRPQHKIVYEESESEEESDSDDTVEYVIRKTKKTAPKRSQSQPQVTPRPTPSLYVNFV